MTIPHNVVQLARSGAFREAEQLDLFSHQMRFSHHFALLDVRALNQNRLCSVLVKYSVKFVIDVRRYPLFESPDFDHKSLIDFMIGRGIPYAPVIHLAKSSQSKWLRGSLDTGRARKKEGLFLVIFDHAQNGREQISDVRTRLTRRGEMVEFHPRSIVY